MQYSLSVAVSAEESAERSSGRCRRLRQDSAAQGSCQAAARPGVNKLTHTRAQLPWHPPSVDF